MEGVKSILASRTMWGVIISLVGKLAAAGGYTVLPEDEALVTAAVSLMVSTVGDLLAAFGRIKATKKLA